jgi:lipopolysaccharide cholinephosphotransferase
MADIPFLQEETRSGFFVDANRKKLWALQLEILGCFAEICEQLGLRYFLFGGTLLGAVRHGGFIPWDDDVDVAMPRKDYEKLLREAPPLLPGHLEVVNKRNEPHRESFYLSRIRNKNTVFKTEYEQQFEPPDAKLNYGVFIDIFPLDGLPADERSRRNLLKKVSLLRRIDCKYRTPLKEAPTLKAKLTGIPFRLLWRVAPINLFYGMEEKALQQYDFDQSPLVFYICKFFIAYEQVLFSNYTRIKFEHLNLRCPAGYDTYLKVMYGDYNVFPPPDKRLGTHGTVIAKLG